MNEVSEKSPLSHPLIHSAFFLAYVGVFLGATIGNIVILIVFVSQRRSRSVTNFFLANLTVADLLVGLFCVIQNGAHFVLFEHGNWPFGSFLCYTYVYTLHMLPNVSAGILVLVSVERLVAVYRPLKVRRLFRRKVLVTSAAFIWIGSAVMNIPYFFASQHMQFSDGHETFSMCTRRHIVFREINVLQIVTIINFVVWYAAPLLTLLFIYAAIGLVVSRAADISNSARNKLLANGSNHSKIGCRTESSSGGVSIEKRRKVGRLSLGIVSSFAICSLPRYVYLMWTVWRDPTGIAEPLASTKDSFSSAMHQLSAECIAAHQFSTVVSEFCIESIPVCFSFNTIPTMHKRYIPVSSQEIPLELRSQQAGQRRQPAASEGDTAYEDVRLP